MVFDQEEIEEAVLDHFSQVFQGQRCPVYPLEKPQDQVQLAVHEINQIMGQSPSTTYKPDQFEDTICAKYTPSQFNQTLDGLPSGKASGYDKIRKELLKNSSPKFKQYLLTFVNRILEDGSRLYREETPYSQANTDPSQSHQTYCV